MGVFRRRVGGHGEEMEWIGDMSICILSGIWSGLLVMRVYGMDMDFFFYFCFCSGITVGLHDFCLERG
jgi:hypothetical protein